MTMADTIAVMWKGRIDQLGSPSELYERPRTAFVAGFLGKSNLLPGTVTGPGTIRLDDGTEVRAEAGARTGRVAVGVRPERLALGGDGVNRITGTVRETAYFGVATEISVETSAGPLTVFHQNSDGGASVPAFRSTVTVTWAPEVAFVVDDDEG